MLFLTLFSIFCIVYIHLNFIIIIMNNISHPIFFKGFFSRFMDIIYATFFKGFFGNRFTDIGRASSFK